jgi:hypothetical protein
MFVVVTTSDQKLIQKLNGSILFTSRSKVNENGIKQTWLFKSEMPDLSDSLISKRSVNDLHDYSHDSIQKKLINRNVITDVRSILSVAYCTEANFLCQTDLWGVFPFFYSRTEDHFIVSDNLFLVAHLLNSSFNEPGFYETLFFAKPKNSNTFYSDISATLPGQSITLNYSTLEVFISQPVDLYGLIKEPSSEILSVKYNEIVKAGLSFPESHISISGGSDSTTLLSALLFNGIKPVCHSWGNDQYLELLLTKEKVLNIGLELKTTSLEKMYEQYREKSKKSMFVTNGYNHTLHHPYYYSDNPDIHLFEGYLGSEFTKGELSDGMYTPVMKDILIGGKTVKEAINHHFRELEKTELARFEEYILDNYGDELVDVNTEHGFDVFKKHLYTFIPSKIFSPFFNLALDNNIKLYWPNFDIEFLRTVYSAGFGLMNMSTIRNDFNEQKSLQPLYRLNKDFQSPFMGIRLDRNVAFKDVAKSEFLFRLNKNFNLIRKKVSIYNRDLIFDQVDYRQHKDYLSDYINESSNHWISDKLSCVPREIKSTDVLRSFLQYAMIQDIDKCY